MDSIRISEDEYVGYYQSLMNLEGLWEAIDQFLKYYYENCCRIAFIVEVLQLRIVTSLIGAVLINSQCTKQQYILLFLKEN